MFLKPRKASTDPRLRSLLQKAVRRGHSGLVERVVARLDAIGDTTWLRSRSVVITCEECWPSAEFLFVNQTSHSKLEVLVRVAESTKQKDAAGLGALAHAYREGDASMLDLVPDQKALRIVGEALGRPSDFFGWATAQAPSQRSKAIVRNAQKYLPVATWEWDKACILATALLAVSADIPVTPPVQDYVFDSEFPYWAALDKHTDEGKRALRELGVRLSVPYRQLIWVSFYCESVAVNELLPSLWFDAERTWRLRRVGLSFDAARELWERARPLMQESLTAEAVTLQRIVQSPVERTVGPIQDPLL